MVLKINISMRNYILEKIDTSKPTGMSRSEWIEELVSRGIDNIEKIKNALHQILTDNFKKMVI